MIIEDYINNNYKYVFPFKISEKNKVREIVTYRNDENGEMLRSFHEKFLKKLNKFPTSDHSYAYKKGLSTKDAIMPHLKSNLFIKLDIKSFFESITKEKFFSVCDKKIIRKYNAELQTCFYNNHLSLGYVTSPKISDMYLYEFDCCIEKYLKKNKELRYSRYSDDILISSVGNSFNGLYDFLSFIKKELFKYDLMLNDKKIREFNISKEIITKNKKLMNYNYYPSVSFLGLNIVRRDKDTVITISKSFIINTLNLIEKMNNVNDKIINIDKKYNELVVLKYKKKINQIFDETRLNQLIEERKSLKSLRLRYRDLHSVVHSRVGYIKHNSKVSYQRFLDKYYNKFNKKWRKF